jgi:hypothetical protein
MSIYTFHVQEPTVSSTFADPADVLVVYDNDTGKTSRMTRLQGQNISSVTETTGATLAANGISILSTVASNYILSAPVIGQRKVVTAPTPTTVKKVVLSSTDGSVTIGSSVSNVFAFSTVAILDQTVTFLGMSATKWVIESVAGSTAVPSIATSTST